MVEKGTFREDLFYRLNVVNIHIPPLRERVGDIPLLVEYFIKKYCTSMNKPPITIDSAALRRLEEFSFPGNVRELENVLERSMVLASGTVLEAGDIKLDTAPKSRAASVDNFLPEGMTLDQFEQSIIREALQRANGNKSQAARLLGLTRNALRYRLSQMGMES
jgi:DNA-binding NtrC family response regulator